MTICPKSLWIGLVTGLILGFFAATTGALIYMHNQSKKNIEHLLGCADDERAGIKQEGKSISYGCVKEKP